MHESILILILILFSHFIAMQSYTPAGRRSMTPLVNAENAEQRLRKQIQRHWQEVHRLCKLHDLDNSGEVDVPSFPR